MHHQFQEPQPYLVYFNYQMPMRCAVQHNPYSSWTLIPPTSLMLLIHSRAFICLVINPVVHSSLSVTLTMSSNGVWTWFFCRPLTSQILLSPPFSLFQAYFFPSLPLSPFRSLSPFKSLFFPSTLISIYSYSCPSTSHAYIYPSSSLQLFSLFSSSSLPYTHPDPASSIAILRKRIRSPSPRSRTADLQ